MNPVEIIGGSGFIGTRLTRRLVAREDIDSKIIDKALSKLFGDRTFIADVRSTEALARVLSHQSVIINLAAEHRDDVKPLSLYGEVNVQGARNICSTARDKQIKTIIFKSSVAVYGFTKIGTDESGEIAPFNDYGRTKCEAEEGFKAWQAEAPAEQVVKDIRPMTTSHLNVFSKRSV